MKTTFAIILSILMLIACSIDDVSAKASKVGNDFDVGIGFAIPSAALTATKIQVPAFSLCDAGAFTESKATTAPNFTTCAAATLPRSLKQPNYQWSGGDSKSSRCKAIVNTYSHYRMIYDSQPYAFGRDIRRLLSEAKA